MERWVEFAPARRWPGRGRERLHRARALGPAA